MVDLFLWAIPFPIGANGTLDSWNWALPRGFNAFYIVSVGFLVAFLFALAVLPTGKRKLGGPGTVPEFSNFLCTSMMFRADLGVRFKVFATADPLSPWGSNPLIVT